MKRRLFSIFFAILLIFSLCACADKTTVSDTDNETIASNHLPELKIGFALYEPYFYLDESGYYTGIDHDIATEACKRIGYQPVFVETSWEKLDSLLESEKVDCIWGRFMINGRADQYQWAGPYLKSPVVVCTRADDPVDTLNDLKNMTVATFVNSYTESYFLGNADEDAPDIKALYTYSSLRDAFVAFDKGYADAVAGHKNGLEQYTKKNPEAYRYFQSPLYISKLGVAFRTSQDSAIVDSLNDALEAMYADGFFQELADSYGLSSDYLMEVKANE